MKKHPITNVAASVQARLLKLEIAGLEQIVIQIRDFLELPILAVSKREKLKWVWTKGGPWKPKS